MEQSFSPVRFKLEMNLEGWSQRGLEPEKNTLRHEGKKAEPQILLTCFHVNQLFQIQGLE